jgi:hypothetical protein
MRDRSSFRATRDGQGSITVSRSPLAALLGEARLDLAKRDGSLHLRHAKIQPARGSVFEAR